MVVKLLSVWTSEELKLLSSEETVEEMVKKWLSNGSVLLPSEETVEEMVVKLLSVWTLNPCSSLRRDC